MGNQLERGPRDSIHDAAALGFRGRPGLSVALFLHPDHVQLEDVSGSDDKVWDRPDVAAVGPVGLKVIGLVRKGSADGICAGVGDEPRRAVIDPGRPLHHLECREAHLRLHWSRETTT